MLTKEQVIAEFKTIVLPEVETLDGCKELWNMNLVMLEEAGKISKHSLDTWTFPKEFEKKFEKS